MIVSTNPGLELLRNSNYAFHLIGSRFVGKFDTESDYDFLMVLDLPFHKEARSWLRENGFSPDSTGMYGSDDRLASDGHVWTKSFEGYPKIDVLPVTKEEAEKRLRFFRAMLKAGHKDGGFLARALKKDKGWPHLWKVLEVYNAG